MVKAETALAAGGASNVAAFRSAYTSAFRAYVDDPGEPALHAAYELGREAVSREIGLLELAQAHHAVLMAALTGVTSVAETQRVTSAAADFLLEVLSAYEMVRRAVAEAQQAVSVERRQAAMIRQLSTLLGDASLAAHGHSSIEEMLQLVSEQTCELTHSTWCVAHAQIDVGQPRAIVAAAGADAAESAIVVEEMYAALPRCTYGTEAVEVELPLAATDALAVPLSALNGQTIGLLAIGADRISQFTDLDRAVLVHIGQMAAAALDRALRYQSAQPFP